MNDSSNRRLQLFFWLALGLLILYAVPILSAPLSYALTDRFARSHFLFYTFLPFLGERQGLLANLTRLLAPLVAAFAAVAFRGPKNFRRALLLIFILFVLLAITLLDVSLLTNERNLTSLNAYEIARPITVVEVDLTLERYQEVLLGFIATILGLTLAAPSQGGRR